MSWLITNRAISSFVEALSKILSGDPSLPNYIKEQATVANVWPRVLGIFECVNELKANFCWDHQSHENPSRMA